MVRRGAVAIVLATLAAVLAARAEQPPLEAFVPEGSAVLAADSEGGIACWLRDDSRLLTWSPDGEARSTCELDDPRLPFTPNLLAYRDGMALLSYLDFAAGSETERKAVVFDTDRCSIVATPTLPGVVHSVTSLADGWLAVSREPFEPVSTVLRLDERGRIADAFSLDRTFDRLLRELGVEENPIARTAAPFAVGRDIWLLPTATYELWYPAQRGRPLRRIAPPACLAARARELRGDERRALLEARAAAFPERLRGPLTAMIRTGSTAATLVAPTAGVTVLGDLVAVKVLDPASPDGARLDLWDLGSEQVVATLPFPAAERVLAASGGSMWVLEQGSRVRRRPLPSLPDVAASPDPCPAAGAGSAATTAALSLSPEGGR